ncbi:MAG: hypothetical protein NTX79_04235 [Candidatus Micrarchaeota archaeon]|nr:hypothetical protein [Candidatus Micrarchaeota archaeon]
MGREKFPKPGTIPWDKIKEVRVTSDGKAYSFEFDLNKSRQRMTVTVAPGQTELTLSSEKGEPVVSAIQRGNEIKILDFSERIALSKRGGPFMMNKKIKKK